MDLLLSFFKHYVLRFQQLHLLIDWYFVKLPNKVLCDLLKGSLGIHPWEKLVLSCCFIIEGYRWHYLSIIIRQVNFILIKIIELQFPLEVSQVLLQFYHHLPLWVHGINNFVYLSKTAACQIFLKSIPILYHNTCKIISMYPYRTIM